MQRITRKWRPPLALVIGGGLAGVLMTPLVAIVYYRVFGNIMSAKEVALLVTLIAVVATSILGFLLWRLVLRPVYALTRHAGALKTGRRDSAVPEHFGTPEFHALGKSIMDMGETLHNRAESMRAYADHVTHELKSPLTSIQGAAELLDDASLPEPDRAALTATLITSSKRMAALLDDLRHHAKASQQAGPGEAVLQDALPVIPGLDIRIEGADPVPMPLDDLSAVLVQLAQNAAAHGADTLDILWEGGHMVLADNGRGIAQGDRARVFDPFFTTRRPDGGTGMGLSIVRSLIGAHGGRIEVLSPENGASFLITFD
ncbi:HAMP domain-containing sensor histidine kinase [Ascidiaceihabitans sp.]|uniref:sensor histidine kinase n=1 Tax=Ascidiaceihabitans sp. TaxID=1872644 RepID=UPI003297A1B3